MQNKIKILGLLCLFIFSIYYTNNIATYMKLKTSLMQKIIKVKQRKKVKAVNAIIDNNNIVPGINGLEVDINASYSKMNNNYNESLLFYKQIKPDISLIDNKDKIITKGNSSKNMISLLTTNNIIGRYCIDHNVKCSYIIDNKVEINTKLEYINNGTDNYYQIERFLNKNNINHNLCIINNNNEKLCRLNNKYLIKPTYTLNDSNLVSYIKKLNRGDIILIDKLSLVNLELLIKEINYHGISIDYLNSLISENNML